MNAHAHLHGQTLKYTHPRTSATHLKIHSDTQRYVKSPYKKHSGVLSVNGVALLLVFLRFPVLLVRVGILSLLLFFLLLEAILVWVLCCDLLFLL